MKISVKDLLCKYDLFTFTKEILNGKVQFSCRESYQHYFIGFTSEYHFFSSNLIASVLRNT